jgi:fumarate reductase (CoM/CoB) subunit B
VGTIHVTEAAVHSKTAKDWGRFMLYEGCTMPRRMVGSRYTTRFVLDKYGFDYITLDNARCCGAPVARSGGEEVSKECRIYNLDLALKAGVDQIVTGCPGCGSQLKSEEAEKMGIHVYHLIEVLYDLAKNGEIYLKDQMRPIPKLTITAHYPCHMHRGMLIDAQKMHETIFNAFPNLTYIEMEDPSRCCGAGGGVRASQKDLSYSIRKKKIECIEETKADIVIAACPFCELQVDEGLRTESESGARAITPQSLIAMFFLDIGEEVVKL